MLVSRYLLLLGFVWLLATMFGAALAYPGYSHVSQFISELGATGAPTGELVSYGGFIPIGLLILPFIVLATERLQAFGAAIGMAGFVFYAVTYIVAGFFPCDYGCRPEEPSLSQVIHNLSAIPAYLAGVVCLFVMAWQLRQHFSLAWVGGVLGIMAAAGVLTLNPDLPTVGLSQRLIEFAVFGWLLLLAFKFDGLR